MPQNEHIIYVVRCSKHFTAHFQRDNLPSNNNIWQNTAASNIPLSSICHHDTVARANVTHTHTHTHAQFKSHTIRTSVLLITFAASLFKASLEKIATGCVGVTLGNGRPVRDETKTTVTLCDDSQIRRERTEDFGETTSQSPITQSAEIQA